MVTKAASCKKTTQIENKIHDISNLAKKAAISTKTTVSEKKVPDRANFLTKNRANFIIKYLDSNNQKIGKLKKILLI